MDRVRVLEESLWEKVPGEVIEADPAWTGIYAEGRERFRALYPALRSAAAAGVS